MMNTNIFDVVDCIFYCNVGRILLCTMMQIAFYSLSN